MHDTAAMKGSFQSAFCWHVERYGAGLAEISRATTVSLDVLKKLSSRRVASTTVENAILIAAFFGKTVNQFVEKRDSDPDQAAANLFALLSPEEQKFLESQLRGMIAGRETQ